MKIDPNAPAMPYKVWKIESNSYAVLVDESPCIARIIADHLTSKEADALIAALNREAV